MQPTHINLQLTPKIQFAKPGTHYMALEAADLVDLDDLGCRGFLADLALAHSTHTASGVTTYTDIDADDEFVKNVYTHISTTSPREPRKVFKTRGYTAFLHCSGTTASGSASGGGLPNKYVAEIFGSGSDCCVANCPAQQNVCENNGKVRQCSKLNPSVKAHVIIPTRKGMIFLEKYRIKMNTVVID